MIFLNEKKNILLTGGLGYIGTHIAIELLKNNFSIIIIDDLSNSKIDKLSFITNYMESNNVNKNCMKFFQNSIFENEIIENIFKENIISCVIHLAAFKSVSESIQNPISYYENNVAGTINILKIMEKYDCYNFIFSSSATVYGTSIPPYKENTQTGIGITNPYGQTKHIQEIILKDLCISNKKWNIIALRYFNPIGHLDKKIRDDPNGIPNNLFPYIYKVDKGELKQLTIFGNDYEETSDGTCIRDFIHVVDLGNAHMEVCKCLTDKSCILEEGKQLKGYNVFNVGTGSGVSVIQLIKAYEKANNTKINYIFGERRDGDLPISTANVDKIFNILGWKTKYTLEDMVKI